MLSEDILTDEKFNALSLEAQNLFLRMLAKADDCGVIPANEYTLAALVNPPPRVRKNLAGHIEEIVGAGLGRVIIHQQKPFFTFKLEAFLEHQGHILNKRTRSEYLRISAEEYDSGKFLELPRNSCSNEETASSTVESRKQKAESSKQKEESRKQEETQIQFAENVSMTTDEHSALVDRLGSEGRAEKAIEILDNYKGSSGKRYKSDYRAILNWVITELEKREHATAHIPANGQGGRVRPILTDSELRKSVMPPGPS